MIEYWEGDAYPDFVAEGTGDQSAINAAICAVKMASYNSIDCVGADDTATGTVRQFGFVVLWCGGFDVLCWYIVRCSDLRLPLAVIRSTVLRTSDVFVAFSFFLE